MRKSIVLLVLSIAALAGCGLIMGLEDHELFPVLPDAQASDGGSSAEAGAEGGPEVCGDGLRSSAEACDGMDLGGATCASSVAMGWIGDLSCTSACDVDASGCTTPATTYGVMTADAAWTTFDVAGVNAAAKGFAGAAFDGRYLYLVPHKNGAPDGIVARYDTQGGFDASASWTTFDVTSVNTGAKGFIGAAFDGRYLYLVPADNGGPDGIVVRYDTQGGFGALASWTTFDVSSVNAAAKGFAGAAFDGRYLYLVPIINGGFHGVVVRYDTQGGFDASASWTTFDVARVNVGAKGFIGAAFDGRYLYLVPYDNGIVVRYDTQDGFDAAASWTTFDVARVNAGAKGFIGAAFDGRYLYLVPHFSDAYHGIVARYDTQGDFRVSASWTTFDVASVNGSAKGFRGAAFDGRYLYLVPYFNGVVAHGIVARFDTQGVFDAPTSWTTFDVTSVNVGAKGFMGAAFDGRYVYLVPYFDGIQYLQSIVARFDAKTPSWLPRRWNASFL